VPLPVLLLLEQVLLEPPLVSVLVQVLLVLLEHFG
jgi:hypothetical protein